MICWVEGDTGTNVKLSPPWGHQTQAKVTEGKALTLKPAILG